MVHFYGYSADCLADDCEHCEQPDGCDCDCHLEDPVDSFGMDELPYDQDFPGGW
jgi:hypothetical protein